MLKPFFAFEGIDGAGKSLQLEHCAKVLQEMGVSVVTTCQPSHLAIGKLIREALANQLDFDEATLALLFAADRLEHLKEIESHLRDSLVLTDRYLLSSLAYNASILDKTWIETINRYATLKPRQTFLFDLDLSKMYSNHKKYIEFIRRTTHFVIFDMTSVLKAV